MRMVFRNQKPICLIILVSLYWLCLPQLPAHGAMVATEDTLDRGSKTDSDRARIKAFVSRKDVIAQFQSYGISFEEALARVDSLTDQEIALMADKLDQLPAPAGADIGAAAQAAAGTIALYALIAAAIITIVVFIIMYALDEGPFKPAYRKF